MKIKLSVNLTGKEMFDFMMKHTYSSFSGYIGLLLSVCALFGFIVTFDNPAVTVQYKVVLIFTALLFTVIQPANLYYRSMKQVKQNENINKPMDYEFDTAGIRVSQGDDSVEYEWSQVTKIASTKKSIFLYTSKFRSFILPRRAFADGELAVLRDIARKNAVNVRSINFGKVD